MVKGQRVGKSHFIAPGQRVALRHGQQQAVLPVGARLQRRGAARRGRQGAGVADAHIRRAFLHGAHHVGGQVLLQLDLHVRVFAHEAPQVVGQELHHRRDAGVHAHRPARAAGVFAQRRLHLLQPEQRFLRVAQQALPRWRERHAARVAQQQRHARQRLQLRKPLAHGRRGQRLARGGAADAARLPHGHKQLQRGEVQAAGKVMRGGGIGHGSHGIHLETRW